MAGRELLVATNPARRRRKKQSAKQRAASLRNLRKARAARGGGRKRRATSSSPKRRRNPPARRRTSSRRIRRRSNPIALPTRRRLIPANFVDRTLIPAAVGGGAAVANDVAYNALLGFIPANFAPDMVEQFRSGYMRHVGKLASALGLAMLAGMVLPRRTADQAGAGMVTVVGYNVVRDLVATFAPDVNMGMYLEPQPTLGRYPGAGWNPGGRLRRRSPTLGRFIAPLPNGGGVSIPPQLATERPYRAPAPMYADESDSYADASY